MNRTLRRKLAIGVLPLALLVAACGSDDSDDAGSSGGNDTEQTETTMADEGTETTEAGDDMGGESEQAAPEGEGCSAVPTDGEGSVEGMADDPVGTAASNNPLLKTLVTAVTEAGLVDTLNSAEALTVFAPTDCAFAALDPATLEAALADPTGLLTQVLGFHVVAGEQLKAADLAGMTEVETFTGEMLEISAEGDTVSVGGGQATVLVPDIQTANATVHLIDAVMLPPSAG